MTITQLRQVVSIRGRISSNAIIVSLAMLVEKFRLNVIINPFVEIFDKEV